MLTGGSLNPARSLGPAIFANVWSHHYIYWIGPLLGAAISGGFYRYNLFFIMIEFILFVLDFYGVRMIIIYPIRNNELHIFSDYFACFALIEK
jgi:hypothetical protein